MITRMKRFKLPKRTMMERITDVHCVRAGML